MTTSEDEVPKLIPVRMLNEFAYCRRLFYLEWTQGQFKDNYYTLDGQFQHRHVDADENKSVLLSSETLGLIARIDLLESREGQAIPVETKRGSAPDNSDESWYPDRIQLCAQGLLLRESGYTSTFGEVYYAESHKRVRVNFTPQLVTDTFKQIQDLCVTAACSKSPDPLIDSNKCPNCSLVGVCLPDETNALLERSKLPPRYLLPRYSTATPVYVTEQGSTLGVRGHRLQIARKGRSTQSVRLLDVSQLNVYGSVQISSQLIRRLFSLEVPICWFSYGGWFQGIAHGLPSKHVELRRKQVAMSYGTDLEIAKAIIYGKIRNCRTLLRRNSKESPSLQTLKDLAEQARCAPTVASLLGYEGAAARTYFQNFSSLIKNKKHHFDFDGRNRRPPADPVNCLLSYLYALLTKELTATVVAIGFDPYIGVYHRPRFGRPALALDLAEEFRPLVADSTVINMINNGEARETHFVARPNGVALTDIGKKAVLSAFERRMHTEIKHPIFGYTITYRRTLEVQARLLASCILGETGEYIAFETR